MNNHTLQNTKGKPITHQNERSAPTAHRRYLSSPAAAILHTEKHKVLCPGFLPNTSPTQDSCSRCNAISNLRFNKHIELRTHEQPHVAEHQGGTNYTSTRMVCTRRTQEVPFIAGCSHSTRKTLGFVLRLPSQHRSHARFRFATCDSTST